MLKEYNPRNKSVREAIKTVMPFMPVVTNDTVTAQNRLNKIKDGIKNEITIDPFKKRPNGKFFRDRKSVLWRQCCLYQLRREGYTLEEIGQAADYDHSTVHIAYKNMTDWIEVKDPNVMKIWKEFLTILARIDNL